MRTMSSAVVVSMRSAASSSCTTAGQRRQVADLAEQIAVRDQEVHAALRALR